ncbi:efflux RND transporter permease subunit [Candidatus Laterigemmans baculatus]|uniref:efflux RND transporter permease subunit n=1 Tax=Candidatus Laterigemmans baculatus TaxID=2770505 RepID=UPI0013DB389E|nr:efflux RND transporter permease subunit [Candidatus Laterigemmans baculatus]
MHLIQAFVGNPIKVSVGALMLSLFGMIALARMPMQLIPEVQTPTITIETRWPGASPQEVEREIIQEQEEQLKSVEGVTKMTSESQDSLGTITMEFFVGANMEESLLKVNSRLQQVSEYPVEADEPVLSTSSSSDSPIAWFILSPIAPSEAEIRQFASRHPALQPQLEAALQGSSPGLTVHRLRRLAEAHPEVAEILPPEIEVPKLQRFAEDFIEAQFERVQGVSNANVLGGREEELRVILDPQRLAARSLTVEDVRRVLSQQNKDTSGGDYWEGKRRYVVRTLNQFRSPEQVGNQLLAMRDGAPVYVRDVAEVEFGFKKPTGVVRRFGESNIAINAIRETGANVLDVMEGLRQTREELNRDILADKGLELTQVYDETEYIYSSINLVNQNIIIGGALTMMVLMTFLHLGWKTIVVAPLIGVTAVAAATVSPWLFVITLAIIIGAGFWFARGALVVGLAIPVSIVGTFLILNLLGRSLNVISLAGMAFAVGMLVDNAVVVLENIYQHYERGDTPLAAAVRGTQEVWGAVVASTLTTLAVFLPVLFVQDEAGQLFRDIALAISAAVALSLLVSVTLIPTFTARLLHPRRSVVGGGAGDGRGAGGDGSVSATATAPPSRIVRWLLAAGNRFNSLVVGINAWIQRGLLRQLAVVVSMFLAAATLSYLLWPKVEYLPSGNRNLVFGILLPPPGYNLDELMEIGETAERELLPYWDVDPEKVAAGDLEYPLIQDFFYVARGRQVFMGVRAVSPTESAKLIPLIQSIRSKVPGTFVVAKQSSLFERGLTAGRTIDIEITGPELPKLVALGGRILGQATELLPTAQSRPVPSLDLSSPEVHVEPKLVQSEAMQVDATTLGYAVNTLVDGAYATDYYIGGDKVDLTILGDEAVMQSSQDLGSLPIATPTGQLVPLSALAEIRLASGPEQINHRERQRAITIEVSPPAEMPLESALELINREIIAPLRDSGELDGGYRIGVSGTADKLRDTWLALRWNVMLAMLITYLLMAALFESWVYPLVIILSVPLGAVGGILGLRLLGVYLEWTGGTPQPLDVLTMLGFVILIGTVVNNPILIVHQALTSMREDALDARTAVLESVRTRIRPIFMTTGTTVLGLLPLVLFPGAGSELYRGLGSVVLGGLLVSTGFTLVFVPTLFTLALRIFGGSRPQLSNETIENPQTPPQESARPEKELVLS